MARRKAPSPAPAAEETLPLDDFLCFAVYSAGHAFNKVYKPLLEKLGLTYPQFLVMVALWEEDGQTVSGLGHKLSLESSTLTPLLKRLESAGYVSRARDAKDERQVRVRLTKNGAALQGKAGDLPACILEATGMSIEELQALQKQVMQLRRSLEAYAKKAA